MSQHTKDSSRRKIILWAASILSGLSIIGGVRSLRTKKKAETVKLLGRDGRLVEVDKSLLIGKSEKISNQQLLSWIKKK